MTTHSKINQTGFAGLEALLILIIIAIIGGTGWYVWQSYSKTSDSLAVATNATNQALKSKKATAKSKTVTPTTQYLVFKEWGVRMKLTANIADAYYEFLPNETANAYLSIKSLVAIAPQCAPSKTSLGAIFRQTVTEYQAAVASPSDGSIPGDVKIGNYYYGFASPQAGCFDSSNTAAQAILTTAQTPASFKTAEKTLEAVPGS